MKPERRLTVGSILFLILTLLVIIGLIVILPRMLA